MMPVYKAVDTSVYSRDPLRLVLDAAAWLDVRDPWSGDRAV
jgi:hypothetical protein